MMTYIAKMRMAIVFKTGLKIYLRLYLGELVLKTSRDHCLYLFQGVSAEQTRIISDCGGEWQLGGEQNHDF